MMADLAMRRPHHPAAGTSSQHRTRCRVSASAATSSLAPLQITYTIDRREIDVPELADLMSRCATHSPGHATHVAESRCDPTASSPLDPGRFQRRLTRALQNSLVCIAAYAPEASVPVHLHRSARGLAPVASTATTVPTPLFNDLWKLAPGILPVLGPRVLVGFARAVGDAALVATVHDVAVTPELRGRGIGVALVEKLTDQLYSRDIIDVGAVISPSLETFFTACRFGEDTEQSVTMTLTSDAAEMWAEDGAMLVGNAYRKRRQGGSEKNIRDDQRTRDGIY